MAEIIIRQPVQIDDIRRFTPMGGTVTAGTVTGPMLMQEYCGTAVDATNKWTVTVGATGAVAVQSNPRHFRLNLPAAADTARLNAQSVVNSPSNHVTTTHIWTKMTAEWVRQMGTLANIVNATSFMGFATDPGNDTRATNGIIGFILASDVLNTITDSAGTETLNVTSGLTLTNYNKYRITINGSASPTVDFYVNDVLQFSHSTNIVTAANCGLAFYFDAEVGATLARLLHCVWYYHN